MSSAIRGRLKASRLFLADCIDAVPGPSLVWQRTLSDSCAEDSRVMKMSNKSDKSPFSAVRESQLKINRTGEQSSTQHHSARTMTWSCRHRRCHLVSGQREQVHTATRRERRVRLPPPRSQRRHSAAVPRGENDIRCQNSTLVLSIKLWIQIQRCWH